MRTDILNMQYLPKLLTAMLVSGSLLLSACNNNDVNEIDTDSTIDKVDTDNLDTNSTVTSEPNPTLADKDQTLESAKLVENEATDIDSFINTNQPSLVTNPTEAGTPEDTVKQALDTLYYGEVKDAVNYYRVDIDNFEQELANTQSAFQQTVESVTITHTQYSVDRIRATITGELKLKGQSEPAPLTYQLRKVGKEWKILG
ncbi:MAG: hypothetical protein L0G25_06275 [Psychrobacter sp.]|nr:hypothetical protein [Psychrobacter sp.]